MNRLAGKVALVTGGSRGYGRAIAERLARDGALVAIHYATNDAAARATLGSIRESGGQAFLVKALLDGTLPPIETLFAALDAELAMHGTKQLDIVVNNAAITLRGSIEETTEELFDRQFAVNTKAPFFLLKAALKRIPDGGRIINISSQTSTVAFPGIAAYSMSKRALESLTHVLAKQLGPRNITVNTVRPGVADTDMNADWLRGNPEAHAAAASLSAFNRIADVSDVADIVAFLASQDARWITGAEIDAAGGSKL
jgi:3-oxoacyl-[acyl-carrier protein] reductase